MSMYRSMHDSTNMWTLESPFEFRFAEKKRKDSSCNVLTAVWITHSTDSNGYEFRTEFSSIPMNITYIDAIGIHLYFVRLYPWEYIRRWLTSIVSTHSFSSDAMYLECTYIVHYDSSNSLVSAKTTSHTLIILEFSRILFVIIILLCFNAFNTPVSFFYPKWN